MQQQQQPTSLFSFDMDLGLHDSTTTTTTTTFLDPPCSANDTTLFEFDFLSPSPTPSTDYPTQQQQDLTSLPYFPFEQQSPLQGDDTCISREPSEISPFSHIDIDQTNQQQQQGQNDKEGPIECYNCKVINTPLWRRTPDRAHILCNACGLYYKQYKRHRPVRIWQRATRWLGIEGSYQNQLYTYPMQQQQQQQLLQQCANCHQTDTPLWRKNSRGQPICNACGLFFKLHHRDRPMELNKINSQRRRRRRREPFTTEEMILGLRADMSRDEMQLVLRIMEERCAFLKAMLDNMPCNTNDQQQQQQQQEIFGYM